MVREAVYFLGMWFYLDVSALLAPAGLVPVQFDPIRPDPIRASSFELLILVV